MAQLYAVTGQPRNKKSYQVDDLNARLPFLSQQLAFKSQQEYQDASIADMIERRKLAERQYGIEEGRFGLEQEGLKLKERQFGLEEKGLGIQQSDLALKERQFGWSQEQAERERQLQKEAQVYQEEVEKRQMGIKAAGLGFTALGTGAGTTLGDITGKASSLWNWISGGKTASGASEAGLAAGMSPKQASNVAPAQTGMSALPLGAMFGGGLVGFGAGQAFGGKNKLTKIGLGAGIGGLTSLLAGNGDWGAALGGGLLGGLGGLL